MLCMLGGDRKKKRMKSGSTNDLKQYTLTFTVNFATYDLDGINRKDLLDWMEDQLKYTGDMIWSAPKLTIVSRKKK